MVTEYDSILIYLDDNEKQFCQIVDDASSMFTDSKWKTPYMYIRDMIFHEFGKDIAKQNIVDAINDSAVGNYIYERYSVTAGM